MTGGNYSFVRLDIGGAPVTVDVDNRGLIVAGHPCTVEVWEALASKVEKAFQHEGWVKREGKPGTPAPWEGSRNAFLLHNLPAINKLDKGRIRKAPFFLRWLWPFVIDNHELSEFD